MFCQFWMRNIFSPHHSLDNDWVCFKLVWDCASPWLLSNTHGDATESIAKYCIKSKGSYVSWPVDVRAWIAMDSRFLYWFGLTIYPRAEILKDTSGSGAHIIAFRHSIYLFYAYSLNAADTCMPMNRGITDADNVCSPTRRQAMISINADLMTNFIRFK